MQTKPAGPFNTVKKASKLLKPHANQPAPSQAKTLRTRLATNPTTKAGIKKVVRKNSASKLNPKVIPSASGSRTPMDTRSGNTRPGLSLTARNPAVIKKAFSAAKKRNVKAGVGMASSKPI